MLGKLSARSRADEGETNKARDSNSVGNLPIYPVHSTAAYHLKGVIYGNPIQMLLDTGAAVSLVHSDFWMKTKPPNQNVSSYCVTRRELLAVVTFIGHFRQYVSS